MKTTGLRKEGGNVRTGLVRVLKFPTASDVSPRVTWDLTYSHLVASNHMSFTTCLGLISVVCVHRQSGIIAVSSQSPSLPRENASNDLLSEFITLST